MEDAVASSRDMRGGEKTSSNAALPLRLGFSTGEEIPLVEQQLRAAVVREHETQCMVLWVLCAVVVLDCVLCAVHAM